MDNTQSQDKPATPNLTEIEVRYRKDGTVKWSKIRFGPDDVTSGRLNISDPESDTEYEARSRSGSFWSKIPSGVKIVEFILNTFF